MSPKLTPQERLRLIKRVVEGGEKVARVCRETGISRVLFYRWLKRYRQANYQPQVLTPKTGGTVAPKVVVRELSAKDRLQMIERVAAGEPVAMVCRGYGVSRVIFYRWKKRYDEAPEGQKLEALWDKRPKREKYYRQAPEGVEEAVLSVVVQYPELSTHKIVEFLPQVGGKPILGNHGVQNVLRRHNLTAYSQRLAYALARRQLPAYDRVFRAIQAVLSSIVALPARRRLLAIRLSAGFALGIFTGIVILGAQGYLGMIGQAPAENKIGLVFASIALTTGSLFFLYSLKYYLTISLVLGFSRHVGEPAQGGYRGGLQPNLDHIKLERSPFVSIHLPIYNERKVVNRLLTACTSMDYENYEVVVVDDSTDETTQILNDWKSHPRVKIIHRDSREGFKGGALKVAFENCDPKTEFVLVFDADFIPYPDTITQFLKYFKSIVGSLTPGDSKVACIQGYQWHVLNKSENWITRGVRSEYAGSYVVERSGTEVLGALKQIAGSVYMIRADLLRKYGWGTSITEDFQLTLRLYEDGYKVVYTPYIQAPSECVATIKRLVRQRMRWAEGHSHNVRKMALRILSSANMNIIEKLEFLYLSPYYLQAFFFMVGTLSWLISETVFRARLPFWTSLWGWSLVLTNMFSLPLMNTVGLFLEESEEKDYLGVLSFVALSYLLVPFQAYASVKGFLESQEGPWFRTPKTGKITDIFTRGKFYRWISGIVPGIKPAPALAMKQSNNPYLALATANNQFSNFKIRPRHLRWIGKSASVFLLIISLLIGQLVYRVPLAQATAGIQIKTVEFYIYQFSTTTVDDDIAAGNGIKDQAWIASTCGGADDASVTINLPESGTITVRNAYVEWRTVVENAQLTVGEIEFCRLGQGLTTQATGAFVAADSAESMPVILRLPVTSQIIGGSNTYYFNARFAASNTVRNSDSAKIVITYEYDQTSATQLKTVRYGIGCRYTQAAAGITDNFTVNPNITESSITVQDHWVEYSSQNISGADHQLYAIMNGTNGSSVQTDNVNVTGYGVTILNQFSTANINLTSNNTIGLYNAGGISNSKCGEWVITYRYSYYSEPATHIKTTRFFAGQLSGSLGTGSTPVGTPSVCVPESSPSYQKVWLRYMLTANAADTLTMRVTIDPGAEQTQTDAFAATVWSGGETIGLFDITSYFNTNFTATCETVTIAASATTGGILSGVRAEIILTYGYDAVATTTGNKTVRWFAGQDYTYNAAATAFTSSFTTFIPDPGTETWRSAALLDECHHTNNTAPTCTVQADNPSIGLTDTITVSYVMDNEQGLNNPGVLASTQITNVAQTINTSFNSSVIHTSGGVAYHTYETSNNAAPEKAFLFIPLAIILPLGMRIYLDNKKRGLNNG